MYFGDLRGERHRGDAACTDVEINESKEGAILLEALLRDFQVLFPLSQTLDINSLSFGLCCHSVSNTVSNESCQLASVTATSPVLPYSVYSISLALAGCLYRYPPTRSPPKITVCRPSQKYPTRVVSCVLHHLSV